MYTTVKTESQQEVYLMGVLNSRAKKTGPLHTEYGPVNWYDAPLDEHGVPVRHPWDWPTQRKYTTESLRALGGHTSRSFAFGLIKISNRYWRAPIGVSRAKLKRFVERGFQEQYCYRDIYKQSLWMQRTLEESERKSANIRMRPNLEARNQSHIGRCHTTRDHSQRARAIG